MTENILTRAEIDEWYEQAFKEHIEDGCKPEGFGIMQPCKDCKYELICD